LELVDVSEKYDDWAELHPMCSKAIDDYVAPFQIFDCRQYSLAIRLLFYRLLVGGMSANEAPSCLWDQLGILNLLPTNSKDAKKYMRNWLSTSTMQNMNIERGVYAGIHASDTLLQAQDRRVAASSDGATKLGKCRMAVGAFLEKDGPGSEIFYLALGLIDMPRGTAKDELRGMERYCITRI